jgi:hypothetical protein
MNNKQHKYIVIQDNEEYTVSYLSEEEDIEDIQIEEAYAYILEPEKTEIILMEDITKKFKFLKETISIGIINKGDKVVLEYPFEGDPNVIERIKPSCGCTAKVEIDKVNNVIRAVYDSKNDDGGISKAINVFFKDNQQLEVQNSLGVKIDNPKKLKVSLKFTGKIREKETKKK